MNPILKEHLISALQTFISTFLVTAGGLLANGIPMQWTSAFWISLCMTAGRSAIKEVFARFAPPSLGGRVS